MLIFNEDPKGWTIIFLSGGYHFWDLQTIFLKNNVFQTIFFITGTFCDGKNFFTTILKNVTGFFIDLIWKKKTLLVHAYT